MANRRWTRRDVGISMGALVLGSVACAPRGAPPTPTPANPLLAPRVPAGQVVGVLANSDIAVGPDQRFLLGLLGEGNRPITDAAVQLQFFKFLDKTTAEARSNAVPAVFRSSPQLGDRGVYVARTAFNEAGAWGVEVRAYRPSGQQHTVRLAFEVKATSATPAIGAPAPASRTVVAATPDEAQAICSARPVDQYHRLSIADALAERKPLLVLFATPAFCESLTCGPSLEVVRTVAAPHGTRLNVVHVEIYENGQPPNVVAAVGEWNLPSEPWVFVVGADGTVADKFEGSITVEELAPAVDRVVAA